MIVASCSHEQFKKHGKDSNGVQRLRCKLCGHSWREERTKPIGNMRIDLKDAATALGLLLEGMSVRSVQRLTGLDRNTICDLILVVGENCGRLLEKKVKNVPAAEVSVDELWCFVAMREKVRAARGQSQEFGDSWCFLAVERHHKMILAHKIGKRDNDTCYDFINRLERATTGRFQLSSDGLQSYRLTVPFVLGGRVDFGVLIKNYAATQEVTRYAPAQIISAERKPQFGNPKIDRISTSHSEVLNRQVRLSLKRWARLTPAHSKSFKHHEAMMHLFVAFYNFVRPHMSLGNKTPAMAAGLEDHAWTIKELLANAAAE